MELSKFKKLTTPIKIQKFLDSFPINWEKRGETYMSPARTLQAKRMHCFEGALVAALAFWLNGQPPLLMDLKTSDGEDHVVTLYKINGYWGAISKTNHATLRFRDPVYKTVRELALSYFHEYFDDRTGLKVLISYSKPFNLKKFGTSWIAAEKDLHHIVRALDKSPHLKIFPRGNKKYIRPADKMERKAGLLKEWPKSHSRT